MFIPWSVILAEKLSIEHNFALLNITHISFTFLRKLIYKIDEWLLICMWKIYGVFRS